jgi:hypothetical protein
MAVDRRPRRGTALATASSTAPAPERPESGGRRATGRASCTPGTSWCESAEAGDSTRTVTASQLGQRSPSGSRTRNTTVAAMPRRMNSPAKTTTKSTASDIGPTCRQGTRATRSPAATRHTADPAVVAVGSTFASGSGRGFRAGLRPASRAPRTPRRLPDARCRPHTPPRSPGGRWIGRHRCVALRHPRT